MTVRGEERRITGRDGGEVCEVQKGELRPGAGRPSRAGSRGAKVPMLECESEGRSEGFEGRGRGGAEGGKDEGRERAGRKGPVRGAKALIH